MSTTTQLIAEHIDHFVGIDISKQWLDVYLRPAGVSLRCANAQQGFTRLDQWLRSHGATPEEAVICMENTGLYGKRLLVAMTSSGWLCSVEKTTITDKVGPEHHRKSDEFDAQLIAEYADRYLDRLHLQWPAEQEVEQLRRLYAERTRLVRHQAATKAKQTQSDQYPSESSLLADGWAQQLAFYEQQINRLEAEMHRIVDAHEGLSPYYSLLVSIPGIAEVTGWLWLIQFYGQAQLNYKKIASRYGFAPHSNRSGSSQHGKTRSSGHGASQMRSIMTMVVRSASTHIPRFKDYKHKKMEEDGKCWPIVRNNMINKMIKLMCAIWNSRTPFSPDHTSRFHRQKEAA
jgi:transposase